MSKTIDTKTNTWTGRDNIMVKCNGKYATIHVPVKKPESNIIFFAVPREDLKLPIPEVMRGYKIVENGSSVQEFYIDGKSIYRAK